MAKGDEDYSGDYTDSDYDYNYNDDLSRYSEEDQNYIRNARTLINGRPADEGEKSERGSFFANKFGKKTDDEGNSKWGMLKKGEQDASNKPNVNGKGGDNKASLGEKENNVKSDSEGEPRAGYSGKFNNAVRGIKDLKQGNIIKGRAHLKKAGPLMAMLALLCCFGGASFFGQMSMPFSLISQFQESFDSIRASQSVRSKSFLRMQMAGNRDVRGCIKAHYFRADEFKVTKRQKAKLANAGITFETDADGVTVMKHTGTDGTVRTIVADQSQVGEGRILFDDIYKNDTQFKNSYDSGSHTWRGSVKAWFDSSMSGLLKKLGITGARNKWSNFDASDEDSASKMKETFKADLDGDQTVNSRGTDTEQNTERNADGEKVETDGVHTGAQETDTQKLSSADTANGGAALKGKITKVASTIASSAVSIANFACGVQDVISGISAVVSAIQILQVLKMASNVFEGIQKAQAGDGDKSPIHDLGNSLTQKTTTTYSEVASVKSSGDNNYVADKTDELTRTRSAMEANGIGALYGGTTVDYNDPSVKTFNYYSMTKSAYHAFDDSTVLGAIGNLIGQGAASIPTGPNAFRNCAVARLTAAYTQLAVELGTTIVECLTPPGWGCLKKIAKKVVEGFAESALKSIVVSIIVSVVVPYIANTLARKVLTDAVGEDMGNALVAGANAYMGSNHRYSGGSVANKDGLIAYLQVQDQVIAEEAQYERSTRSPFDITSKYTFLGSLANQFIPIASQMTSITSALNGAGTVLSNSINALTPKSSAVSAGIKAQAMSDTTKYSCPDVYELGGISDAYCNPYIITDTSTLYADPAEVVNSVDDAGGLEDVDDLDGENVPVVKEDSNLAKYIVYCGQRTSPFGMADQNIASEVDGAGTVGGTVGQAVIGSLGFIGSGFDIASNTNKINNLGWITGSSCVIGNNEGDDAGSEDISWKEAKKYQRFIEDQRLAEAEGLVEESAVTKYLAKYYEKHPLDNSYEGILARYSGLTKENVIAVLDLIKVSEFVADYKPAHLYPYPQEEKEETKIEIEDNNIEGLPTLFANVNNVIYDNPRYRNYAI